MLLRFCQEEDCFCFGLLLRVDKKGTPKRRRDSLAGELSPTGMPKPKTPVSAARLTVPLSERQQMALLMQMTADKSNQPSNGKCGGGQHFLRRRPIA